MVKRLLISVALSLVCVAATGYEILPTPQLFVLKKGHTRCAKVNYIKDASIPADGYSIKVSRRNTVVRFSTEGGRLYSDQTLASIRSTKTKRNGKVVHIMPCCEIYDFPRCQWRGLMLDSGRQYQSIETIKSKIDLMFSLRMNVFHWHFTEGLGWRLEIQKYPDLTRKGAFVSGGVEQQGFYSQDQVREIIEYAAARNITVVPEIDIPGHAEAALYSYPEYSCFGEPARIPETGFTDCIFCAGKDSTLEFLKDILDEVCELFPSEYIHLGGDEAPKGNWDRCPDCKRRIEKLGLNDSHQLQLWLSGQMALYLKSKGRKAIFWEDVINDASYPLPDNVVIHWWNYRGNKDKNYRKALDNGYQVLCSPNYYNYLNFPETPWRGYAENRTFTLRDAYECNPADAALSENDPLTLGLECALWTDYMLTEDMLDLRLKPRIYALAELMWRGKVYSYDEFTEIIKSYER